ncbi:MAG: CoA transferase [Candidatus Poseidoniaceae archaeon]|nr:CoA transferase [Candidatus Poseidoniaceae archaeon]
MQGILSGIKVLDLSRILAGPLATQYLADFGAEVTKVEAPWGDDTRHWGPPFATGFDGEDVAAYYLSANRGKQVITANLKNERERIRQLIEQSDVVVENFKPGTLERLLGPIPSHVILCSMSGYGASGPRKDEPGYDLAMQAQSGLMSVTGEADGPPNKVGVALIDVITGLNAVSAILAALLHKEKTGVAKNIEISLWDCAIAALVNQAHNFLESGKSPHRMGSAHPNLVPYRAFEVEDGWFVVAVGSDPQLQKMSEILKISAKPQWDTNAGRIADREQIEMLVQDACRPYTRAQLEELLEGIPSAPVNTIEEALSDPQSIARGNITQFAGVNVLANPLRFMSDD